MTQPDLDQLLHLIGTLGADAAWLLRGSEEATLTWSDDDEDERTLPLLDDTRTAWSPLLIARFPDDGDETHGLIELKLPPGGDHEIQAAAILSIAMDRLTKIGPNTTRRVLEWVLTRYGVGVSFYAIRDRRPQRSPPSAPAELPVEPAPAPPLDEAPDPAVQRGANLRARRQALCLTQRELAERAKLAPSRISAIELGGSIPSDAVWTRIEAALEQAEREGGKGQ